MMKTKKKNPKFSWWFIIYLLPEGFFVLEHGHLHDLHVALPHELLPVHHHPRSRSYIDPGEQILRSVALELEQHTKLLKEGAGGGGGAGVVVVLKPWGGRGSGFINTSSNAHGGCLFRSR